MVIGNPYCPNSHYILPRGSFGLASIGSVALVAVIWSIPVCVGVGENGLSVIVRHVHLGRTGGALAVRRGTIGHG
jgi:hypothetical protein